MRQYVANLGLAILIGGCSFVYNPDNIHKPADAKQFSDAPPPDSETIVDANPAAISIDSVFPLTVDEGTGMFNSRPAIVAFHGDNFVKDAGANLAVTLSPSNAATVLDFKVSTDHKYVVVALQIPVDPTCSPPTATAISVTISEADGMGGTAMAQLPNAFAIHCLHELTAAVESTALDPKYSTIELPADTTFHSQPSMTPNAILRSASHIVIGASGGNAIVASAVGQNPGPGGFLGGAKAANGGGPGYGTAGNGTLTGGGGGAGFAVAGAPGTGDTGTGGAAGAQTGDIWISSYARNQASGGGGGQNGLSNGGTGGGGGGTVELTAGGDVSVGAITATGGDATTGAGNGGAGAGGVILIRAGNMLTVGALSVAAGTTTGDGGAGSVGRMRVDAALGTIPGGVTIGPMFVSAPSLEDAYPTLNVRGTPNDHTALVEVFDKDGNVVDNGHVYMPAFGTGGTATETPVLKVGYNRVCALVAGNTDPTLQEGTNCIEIGYAP